jgi:hypothetical protein
MRSSGIIRFAAWRDRFHRFPESNRETLAINSVRTGGKRYRVGGNRIERAWEEANQAAVSDKSGSAGTIDEGKRITPSGSYRGLLCMPG